MKYPHFYEQALLIDIDGTVLRHRSGYKTKGINPSFLQKPLKNAVKWVNKKFDEGYGIFFFTSRLPSERQDTEALLDKYGFKYHEVIFGKPYAYNIYIIDDRNIDAIKVRRNFGVGYIKDLK
jgi:hypothetical protein